MGSSGQHEEFLALLNTNIQDIPSLELSSEFASINVRQLKNTNDEQNTFKISYFNFSEKDPLCFFYQTQAQNLEPAQRLPPHEFWIPIPYLQKVNRWPPFISRKTRLEYIKVDSPTKLDLTNKTLLKTMFCMRCFIFNCQTHPFSYGSRASPTPLLQALMLKNENFFIQENGCEFLSESTNSFNGQSFNSFFKKELSHLTKNIKKNLVLSNHTLILSKKVPSYYTYCMHSGPCQSKTCSCLKSKRKCDKYCACNIECKNRFFGCKCSHCDSRSCKCFALNRECDPDLCFNCCSLEKGPCKNMSLQRCSNKRTYIGVSNISGWGLFSGQRIDKHEFIEEYTGELISQSEADVRGLTYDLKQKSFLFNLDSNFVIDATKKGSKMRFINHSSNPNCITKLLNVLGTRRIGLFSLRVINEAEELTFNYNYETHAIKFISRHT